jgi:hypothetical protein
MASPCKEESIAFRFIQNTRSQASGASIQTADAVVRSRLVGVIARDGTPRGPAEAEVAEIN